MEAVEGQIEKLAPKEQNGTLNKGERKSLKALRKSLEALHKDKDELRNDKLHIYTITLAHINRLAQLEAQQGAGTVQNVFTFHYCSIRGNMIYDTTILFLYSFTWV
jgi:hypothetical protein